MIQIPEITSGPYYVIDKHIPTQVYSVVGPQYITEYAIRNRIVHSWRDKENDEDMGLFCNFYMSSSPDSHAPNGVPYRAEDLFFDYEEAKAECEKRNTPGYISPLNHKVYSLFLKK